MKRCLCVIAMVLFTNSLFAQQEVRHGLSTKFTDVILSGLKPGMVYSNKKEKGLPYKVMNKTDKEIEVDFKKKKMKSKKRSINDVIMEMEIPDEEGFYGKNFAFVVAEILWFDIPVELYSRVYFKTQEKNEEKAEK